MDWFKGRNHGKNGGFDGNIYGKMMIYWDLFGYFGIHDEPLGFDDPYANHGAGIFTYKTGCFCSGKCWCAYSSTMVRIWDSFGC